MRVSVLLCGASSALADHGQVDVSVNPIRRVVNLLQAMQKKVEGEGAKQKEVHDKYMCYCQTAGTTLSSSIDNAGVKIPQVESAIKEAVSQKAQFEQELKDHQVSRADAKAAMDKATAIRTKEAAEYAKESGELKTNLSAMKKAITAIEKGMSGSFLQSQTAKVVERIAIDSSDMTNYDRQLLVSFLSGQDASEYTPSSGQITGILKEMEETMSKDLADMTANEEEAKANYAELMAAKTKEVEASTKSIEEKTVRVGNLGVEIEGMKNDLSDTEQQLLEDKEFLANMDTTCEEKRKLYEEAVKMRAEELVALADTIKILNDDDALELFKKTLPGSSLLQLHGQAVHVARKALEIIRKGRGEGSKSDHAAYDLIAVALTGRKVNFDKVIALVDKLVSTLRNEQLDDNHKKEYCEGQFDFTEDKKKELEQHLEDLSSTVENSKEKIATLADELKALADGLTTLDKEVQEQTETRQEEHSDYSDELASNSAAKELLGVAKNRMNKFYNPAQYKAPPKRELSEQEQIAENMGAFLQIKSRVSHSDAPPPPPEAVEAYQKKGQESNGVVAMIDLLIADLDKQITEAETTEKDAQAEYEAFMKEAARKRVTDSKAITDKEELKADTEAELQAAKDETRSKTKELMATEEYMGSLHKECDWLLANYDLRKDARAGEIDALNKAKAVLSGADFALVQTHKQGTLRGS